MSNLSDGQFPVQWRPDEGPPAPRERRCSGPGPFGAGCHEEGIPMTSSTWKPGNFIGTRYDRKREDFNTRLCLDCGHEVTRQRDYDQAKPTLDHLRKVGMEIDSNVRIQPLWEPTAEDHNKKNRPWRFER